MPSLDRMSATERTALTYRYERWRALASASSKPLGARFFCSSPSVGFMLVTSPKHSSPAVAVLALCSDHGSWRAWKPPAGPWPKPPPAWPCWARPDSSSWQFSCTPGVCHRRRADHGHEFRRRAVDDADLSENYPERDRGKLFSRTFMIRIATAAAFSELAGRALSAHLEWYRGLLLGFALAFGLAAFVCPGCPRKP